MFNSGFAAGIPQSRTAINGPAGAAGGHQGPQWLVAIQRWR
jgi:hypothetical protein